jgi:hypothetical protein
LRLNNILVSPQIIKNFISIRQFTTDNNCSVEFDPAGCSVKDLNSRNVIVRCNSSGPLYPLRLDPAHSLVAKGSSPLWHRRLGHPDHEALSKLASSVSCSIEDCSDLCHACQLGRHVRLPFPVSSLSLILYIVICGHHQSSVSQVINIIWLFLITALITCGLFLCISNLTLSAHLSGSLPTPPHSLLLL